LQGASCAPRQIKLQRPTLGRARGDRRVWPDADARHRSSCRSRAGRAGLQPLIDKIWRYYKANGIRGQIVALKVKREDFTQITRSKAAVAPVATAEVVDIMELFVSPVFPAAKGIQLLGITLSSLDDDDQGEPQLALAL
jgi:nucleotidyltransferase/DNA polymerase involved in DNA repair